MEIGCTCTTTAVPQQTPAASPTASPVVRPTGEQADVLNAIKSASAAVLTAEAQVVQASRKGKNVGDAVRKIEEAKEIIEKASALVDEGNYLESKSLAQTASEKADEAVGLIPADEATGAPTGASALIILAITVIAVLGAAGYFIFLKPKKPNPQPATLQTRQNQSPSASQRP
jgi:hypothetical protein